MYDICELLGIEVDTFQTVITCRNVRILQTSDSTLVTTEMSADEASHFRDRLCKALYSRLFMWLVKTINSKIKVSGLPIQYSPFFVVKYTSMKAGKEGTKMAVFMLVIKKKSRSKTRFIITVNFEPFEEM